MYKALFQAQGYNNKVPATRDRGPDKKPNKYTVYKRVRGGEKARGGDALLSD